MKIQTFCLICILVLTVSVLGGCGMANTEQTTPHTASTDPQATQQKVAKPTEQRAEDTTDSATQKPVETTAATQSDKKENPALTAEEAQNIALKHAGFTADQVTRLHTEYEVEHGVPHYEVEFHQDMWEYDYEIHANTGEVLSFNKDD